MSAPRTQHARTQVPRFVAVGVTSAALSYTVFRMALMLLRGLPRAPALAQVASYSLGAACSFVLNRQWTFRSGAARGPEFARFVTAQLAMLAISSTAVGLAVGSFGLPVTPSWVLITGAVAVLSYLTMHHWVFRVRGAPAAGD